MALGDRPSKYSRDAVGQLARNAGYLRPRSQDRLENFCTGYFRDQRIAETRENAGRDGVDEAVRADSTYSGSYPAAVK